MALIFEPGFQIVFVVVFVMVTKYSIGQDNLCWNNENSTLFTACTCLTNGNTSNVILQCDFGQNYTENVMYQYVSPSVTGIRFQGQYACEVLSDFSQIVENLTLIDIQSDGNGNVMNVTQSTLLKLGRLKILRLHNCNIRDIENGDLKTITELEVLDLSGNSFLIFDAVAAFIGSLVNSRLKVLNISGIHNAEDMDTITITHPVFQAASFSELKVLDFSWTRLFSILDNFNNLGKLEVVNLTGTPLLGEVACLSTLLTLDSLTTFVMDKWPVLPRGQESIVNLETPKYLYRRSPIPCVLSPLVNPLTGCYVAIKNLRTIQLRVTDLNSFYLKLNHDFFCLENQDLVNMILSGSTVSGQIASFRGFYSLKYFDLSHPISTYDGAAIKPDGFHDMPSLEVLIIPGIKMSRYSHSELELLVSKNPSLKILDISQNGLSYLPENMLSKNTHLEMLNMSGNILGDLNLNISTLMSIEIIDFTSNRLKYISSKTIEDIRSISKNKSVSLFLSDNSFICDCDLIKFSTMQTLSTKFTCDLDGVSYTLGNLRFTALPPEVTRLCDPPDPGLTLHLILIISLSSAAVLVSIIVYVLCVLLRRRRYPKLNLITLPTAPLKAQRKPRFIAFLAYCSKDYEFACNNLYPRMNKKLRVLLKQNKEEAMIIVNDQNFLPGGDLDRLISKAILECYVTIAVISEGFLESSWCQFEVLKAFSENVPLVPLYISKLDPGRLTGIVEELYNTRARILWPAKRYKDKRKQQKLEEETIDLLCHSVIAHVKQCKRKEQKVEVDQNRPHDNAGFAL